MSSRIRRATLRTTLESSTIRQDFISMGSAKADAHPLSFTHATDWLALCRHFWSSLRFGLGLGVGGQKEHRVLDTDTDIHVRHARQNAGIEWLDAARVDKPLFGNAGQQAHATRRDQGLLALFGIAFGTEIELFVASF